MVFFLCFIIQYCIVYFLFQIVPALATGSSFSWFLYHFDVTPLQWIFFFLTFSYFMTLQDAPGSSFIFPAPVLEWAICPRSPGPFSWRMRLEIKIWTLSVLIALEVLLFLYPFTWQSKKIYVCILKRMYIYLSWNIFICNYLYLY